MKNATRIRGTKRRQKGVALLIVIFALLLVTGIALAMLANSDTETQISRNYRDSQRAYFSALAGIQEGRVAILNGLKPSGAPSNTNANGVIYITNPTGGESVQPWNAGSYFDDELCHESFPSLPDANDPSAGTPNSPCTQAITTSTWYTPANSSDPNTKTAAALDYKWVRITPKENRSAGASYPVVLQTNANAYPNSTTANWYPICWTGTTQVPIDPGMGGVCTSGATGKNWESVYRVASMAQTPQGSRRMVIAEVAVTPPLVTKGAVDSQDHVTLNGKLTVNGFDSCTCNLNYGKDGYDVSSCTPITQPNGSTTYNCPGRGSMSCDNSKWAIFASKTIDSPTASETLVAGPNPPTIQNQTWPYDMKDLVDTYSAGAVDVTKSSAYKWSCTAPTYDTNGNLISNGSCGTQNGSNVNSFGTPPPFPPIYNSDGSLNTTGLNPQPVSQNTYIPGSVKLTSSWSGDGILIVDGDLEINGGLQFYGLILVRGAIKFTGGGKQSTNIIGAVLAGQESYVDNTLGGSATIDFNSCALKQNKSPMPPRLVSIREASY